MFSLPELPYGYAALQPYISERTLKFHHDKHHAAYVKTANELVEKGALKPNSLEDLVKEAASSGETKLFNNAAQAWNHGFFWQSMRSPDRAGPNSVLQAAIANGFGDLAGLKQKFVEVGSAQFGSGWVWLTCDAGENLSVRSTHDAEDLLTQQGVVPLLVCDVWEHAYYLDYQNDRKGFLEAWCDHLANWSFAAAQLAAATGGGAPWRYPVAAGS